MSSSVSAAGRKSATAASRQLTHADASCSSHHHGHTPTANLEEHRERRIRVFDNEGGVTHYAGGCRVLIIPAGYVGSAIWGSLFVMFSGGRRTATGAAGVLVGMLLISLCYAPNRTMIYLNLSYAVFTSVFIYLEWQVFTPVLNYVVLFYGAFVGIHAIFDTYQDTIRRTVLQSDAYACYEQHLQL
eukprot:scaffold13336_cov201-Alexandrium_tamarense.AAC.3